MVTDAIAEYVPRMRERVCVEGRDEVFVVIYVDRERAVADLVSTERVGELLESVAFSAIYPESMGSVTRSSTSAGDAPGIAVVMSSIGTRSEAPPRGELSRPRRSREPTTRQ